MPALKLDRLEAAATIGDLAALPGNRFENLKGDRKGQCSIRISGRRGITGDAALQSLYDLRLAQQKAGKAIDRLPTLKKVEHSPT